MCSASSTSASSSIAVPRVACCWSSDRTASAISRRPLVAHGHVDEQARVVRGRLGRVLEHLDRVPREQVVARPPGSRATAQPPGPAPCPRATFSSGTSSAAGRVRLSVDRSQRVTTSTPVSRHQSSSSKILFAPLAWPWLTSGIPPLGPPPVPVARHPDVARHRIGRKRSRGPALVQPVDQVTNLMLAAFPLTSVICNGTRPMER